VVREIAQGACDIGIGNTVALAQLRDGREGPEWTEWARAVKAIPTTFQGGGTHVNLTGAALARARAPQGGRAEVCRISAHTRRAADLCGRGIGISGDGRCGSRTAGGGDRIVRGRCAADRRDRGPISGRPSP